VELLEWTLLGNTLRAWAIALAVGLLVFFGLGLVKSLVYRQIRRLSERTATYLDAVLARVIKVTRFWIMAIVALWAGSLFLVLPERTAGIIGTLTILALLVQFGIWGVTAIRAYVQFYGETHAEEDAASVMTVRALGFLGSVALWTIILLVVLDNLGIDVTAMIAGLGIGGIAVALALQNILGDLFASLSIVLDKPFVVGDFIIVDDLLGTVEHVGLKTTRVRSLSGEQLVFANSDLLNSRIRNFKRMFERRVVFEFGVEYGTAAEELEWIPAKVREIIDALPDTRFDRAHFSKYGDSSLDFEVVYHVLVPDFNTYMDRQQAINLAIYRGFAEQGISFAFPTRTIHVTQG
jgi:small-conductance mechanosensitive channel